MIDHRTAKNSDSAGYADLMGVYAEALLAFPTSVLILTILFFAVGLTLSFAAALSILCLALAGVCGWCRWRLPHISGWRVLIAASSTFLLSAFAAAQVYDLSWDGQAYHQPAIFALAQGWNPLRTMFSDAMLGSEGMSADTALWIQHYPKASWIIGAVIYRVGASLEAAKAINIILVGAAFATVCSCSMRLGMGRAAAIALALAAAFNPIAVVQMPTFYNDGLAGSAITILACALGMLALFNDRRDLPLAVMALILAANLKFSILAIVVVLCLAGALAIIGRHRRQGWRTVAILVGAGIAAVMLIGWAPYGQNMIGWGHPFYPVMGPHAVNIMSGNTPRAFADLGPSARFMLGTFGHRTTTGGAALMPALKLRVIADSGYADARIGGFGILFPLVALLTMFASAGLFLSARLSRGRKFGLLACLAALALSIFIHPENWWARYVPQLWLIPVTVAGFALLCANCRALQRIGWGLVLALLLDTATCALGALHLYDAGHEEVAAERAHIQRNMPAGIVAAANYWFGPVHRLRDFGIKVRIVPKQADLSCSQPSSLASSAGNAGYCPAPVPSR